MAEEDYHALINLEYAGECRLPKSTLVQDAGVGGWMNPVDY